MKQVSAYMSLIILLTMCSSPLEEDAFDYEQVLVVEGVLTDQPDTHWVKLSWSAPVGDAQRSEVEDAVVWVEDGAGSCYDYFESNPGLYASEVIYQAEEGETYQLLVQTNEGRRFASTPSGWIKSPPIDSIYDRYLSIAPTNVDTEEPGIQLLLDSHDETGEANYFRYEWEEAYKIEAPLSSDFIYDPALDSIIPRVNPIHICYAEDASTGLLLATSIGSTSNVLREVPLRYLPSGSEELQTRYSILVRQYVVSQEAYGFYRKFNELIEGSGSLFDKQVGAVIGNMYATEDPNEIVLGYFEVSGVSDRRVYFDLEDFDNFQEIRNTQPTQCNTSNWIVPSADETDFYLVNQRGFWEIMEDDPLKVVPKECASCLDKGSVQPPDFWIE